MPKEILCLADDTTGALDAAGSFFSRGYDASVLLSPSQTDDSSTATVYDLHNRYDDERTHRQQFTRDVQSVLRQQEKRSLFLKIDSTLRGHIVSDVEVLEKTFPDRPIFIAPAFPHNRRVCVDGAYYVDGKAITQTVFAKDHAFRLHSAHLRDNFPRAEHVDTRLLDAGAQALADYIQRKNKTLWTFDTRVQSDLESIASTAMLLGATCVGSSGLARAFPVRRERQFSQQYREPARLFPTVCVVGSMHPASREQLHALMKQGVAHILLHRSDLLHEARLSALSDQVQSHLVQGKSIVLASPDEVVYERAYMRDVEHAMQVIVNFAALSHNSILVGGETTRGILTARGLWALRIVTEFEPGVPVSCTSETDARIFTKAGGFGSPTVLCSIFQHLQKEDHERSRTHAH